MMRMIRARLSTFLALDPEDRLPLALSLAIFIHAFLLMGIHFAKTYTPLSQTLEITLAAHKSAHAPTDADFLAQANQQGSGSLKEKAEVSTTEQADFNDNEIHKLQLLNTSRPPSSSNQPSNAQLTAQSIGEMTLNTTPTTPSPAVADNPTMPISIQERALEIASLQAQLSAKEQAYAKRPRKQQITAISARASRHAAYLNAWRTRVETLGNRNYPQLNIDHLYGSLRLLVAVNANGTLAEVRVLKSSGRDSLDRAAIRIVQQAAPFEPFPTAIRRDTDILEIIRTWKFEPGFYTL